MIIPLGTKSKVTVKNDGGLYLTRQGEYTGSDRVGTVPLMSFEVRDAFEVPVPSHIALGQTATCREYPSCSGRGYSILSDYLRPESGGALRSGDRTV